MRQRCFMTMGRPRIEFDEKTWATIEECARIHCTESEIAGILGVSIDTIDRRVNEEHNQTFAAYIKRFADQGRKSLRRAQWAAAEAGNPTMLVWLGKQHLAQRDQPEQSRNDVPQSVEVRIVDGRKPDAPTS